MNVLDLILDALATSRATRLVVDDEILRSARDKVLNRYPAGSSKLGYILTCHYCTSVWVGGLVVSGVLPRWVRDTLALSEAAILVRRLLE